MTPADRAEVKNSSRTNKPPVWPGCRPVSNKDPYNGLSEQEAWLLTYAGWYRHFLGTQEKQDRLTEGWAHKMVEATLSPAWYGVAYWMPDTKRSKHLREEFLNLRQDFDRDSKDWLARAAQWQSPQGIDPDPEPSLKAIAVDQEQSVRTDQQPDAEDQGQTAGTDHQSDAQLDLFG